MTLNAEETAFITAAIEIQAQEVLKNFAHIRTSFGDSDEFVAEMTRIAKQTGSGHEYHYGGIRPDQSILALDGGIEEALLENVFCALGLSYEASRSLINVARNVIHAVIMRQAMAKDKDFDLFIRSLIAGAYKHSENYSVHLGLDVKMVEMLVVSSPLASF